MSIALNLATGETDKSLIPGAIAGEFPACNPRFTGRDTWLSTIIENGTPYSFNAFQKT